MERFERPVCIMSMEKYIMGARWVSTQYAPHNRDQKLDPHSLGLAPNAVHVCLDRHHPVKNSRDEGAHFNGSKSVVE
jgi:hypothetical protein